MIWLKQSTAVVIQFGPFLDKTDGITLKTNATTITDIDHASTGIFLSKNGGDAAIRHASVTASVADDYGMMRVTLDTTDTNTLGHMRASFAKAATYLPVWADFMVVPANVWDSMFGADNLQVDVTQLLGTAWLAPYTAGTPDVNAKLHGGTAQTGRDIGESVLLSSGTGTGQLDFTSGVVKSNLVQILGSAISGTAAQISAAFTKFFDKASPTGTINSLPDAVAGANGGLPTTNGTKVSQTVDLTAGQSIGVSGDLSATMKTSVTAAVPTAAVIAGAVCDEVISTGHSTTNSLGKVVYDNLVTEFAKVPKSDSTVTFNATALASIKTQAVAALDDANTELAAIPTTTGSLRQLIQFLHAYFRNKKTVTVTTETVMKEDATTTLGTATVADDGTTFSRGEMS